MKLLQPDRIISFHIDLSIISCRLILPYLYQELSKQHKTDGLAKQPLWHTNNETQHWLKWKLLGIQLQNSSTVSQILWRNQAWICWNYINSVPLVHTCLTQTVADNWVQFITFIQNHPKLLFLYGWISRIVCWAYFVLSTDPYLLIYMLCVTTSLFSI